MANKIDYNREAHLVKMISLFERSSEKKEFMITIYCDETSKINYRPKFYKWILANSLDVMV